MRGVSYTVWRNFFRVEFFPRESGRRWTAAEPASGPAKFPEFDTTMSSITRFAAGLLAVIALGAGSLSAAVGDVTPLNRADLTKVDAILTKLLKGKPTTLSGTKEELDAGWRIACTASVGSGGNYDFVVKAEKTMTLGYIETQKPAPDTSPNGAKPAMSKEPAKK